MIGDMGLGIFLTFMAGFLARNCILPLNLSVTGSGKIPGSFSTSFRWLCSLGCLRSNLAERFEWFTRACNFSNLSFLFYLGAGGAPQSGIITLPRPMGF